MTAVIVLGMHRSGTSMLAGILHYLGVFMGHEVMMGQMPENPAGYWEDRQFMELNQRILTAVNSGWEDPEVPDINPGKLPGQLRADMWGIIYQRRRSHRLWGWKDPRTCLTLPAWLPLFGWQPPKIIIIRRHKEAVVRSLYEREPRRDIRQCEHIHDAYIDRIHRYTAGLDTLEVQYEILIGGRDLNSITRYLKIAPTAAQWTAAQNHIKPELNRCG